MTFRGKSAYPGPFDKRGVPLLHYRGRIGKQYNPIAVSQYGLAVLNRDLEREKQPDTLSKPVAACADWLVANLKANRYGIPVWLHEFDWDYFRALQSPWYSGLAQGQGISLLVRAFLISRQTRYIETAVSAFRALVTPIDKGGTLHIGADGWKWIEEYITDPPTHILNGMIWAMWGLKDLVGLKNVKPELCAWLDLNSVVSEAEALWEECVKSLEYNINKFDTGWWSLYDLAPLRIRNTASPFYHALHVVQLDVLYRLTGKSVFADCCQRWADYARKKWRRLWALGNKIAFKVFYY